MLKLVYKKGDVMYTEDDKYTKHKRNNSNTSSNSYNNLYDENFYGDFSDVYNDSNIDYSLYDKLYDKINNYNKKGNVNKLDTSYFNDYNDIDNYNTKSLNKRKYIVIIIILVIFFIALLCILVKILNVSKPPVGNNNNYVRLQYDQLDMHVGESKKLDLILSDVNSQYKIEWFSNDDNIVMIDNNGNIKAINEGNAIILVAYYLNDKIYDAQCHINVSK